MPSSSDSVSLEPMLLLLCLLKKLDKDFFLFSSGGGTGPAAAPAAAAMSVLTLLSAWIDLISSDCFCLHVFHLFSVDVRGSELWIQERCHIKEVICNWIGILLIQVCQDVLLYIFGEPSVVLLLCENACIQQVKYRLQVGDTHIVFSRQGIGKILKWAQHFV